MLDIENFRLDGELATGFELTDPYPLAGEVAPYRLNVDLIEVPLP